MSTRAAARALALDGSEEKSVSLKKNNKNVNGNNKRRGGSPDVVLAFHGDKNAMTTTKKKNRKSEKNASTTPTIEGKIVHLPSNSNNGNRDDDDDGSDADDDDKDAKVTTPRPNPTLLLNKKWTKESIRFDGKTFRLVNEVHKNVPPSSTTVVAVVVDGNNNDHDSNNVSNGARSASNVEENTATMNDGLALPRSRKKTHAAAALETSKKNGALDDEGEGLEKDVNAKVAPRKKEKSVDRVVTNDDFRIISSQEQQSLSSQEQHRMKHEEKRQAYNAMSTRGKKGRPKKDEMISEEEGVILCKMCENELKNKDGSKFRKYFCCDACVANTSSTFVPSIGVSVLFCQQCRKPHLKDEFDYGMRSCRESLNIHRVARLKRTGKYNESKHGATAKNNNYNGNFQESRGEKNEEKGGSRTLDYLEEQPRSPSLRIKSELSSFFTSENPKDFMVEETLGGSKERQQNMDKVYVKSIADAFRRERDVYTKEIEKYGLEQAAFDKAIVPGGSAYNPVARLVVPEIPSGTLSVFPPAMTKSDRAIFGAMRKTAHEPDVEIEVRRSWELNQASEDGVHVKVKNASPSDLHPDLVHFVREAFAMEPLAIEDAGTPEVSPRAKAQGREDSPRNNKKTSEDLLGTIRPGCVSFSLWVSDPGVLENEFGRSIFCSRDHSLFNRLRGAFVKGVANIVQDEETKATIVADRDENSVYLRHRNVMIMTEEEKIIANATKPRIFHVSARSVLSDSIASIAIIGANLLGENSYLNVKFNDEVHEVCLDPELNTSLQYSILPRDEHMNVTPVMIRTYVRFSTKAFSSPSETSTRSARVSGIAILSSFASLFKAPPSKVKLATLQIVRDCNASEAEPIVVTTSKRIHREIRSCLCSEDDPQVMGTITRRAFLSCAKNCEDERVATGVVTKCTVDAMEALKLHALATELRRLDLERFFVSTQKALANVCDPFSEVMLSISLFASSNKFYGRVKKVASPEVCAELRKKLSFSHAPNICFVALMLLMHYSSIGRTSLYAQMRERFFLMMRMHALVFAWYSVNITAKVLFETSNAVVNTHTDSMELREEFRCPQKARISGFLVVVFTASIISLMHSARPTWDIVMKICHTLGQLATAVCWQCNATETITTIIIVVAVQGTLSIPGYWTQMRAWRDVWMAHPFQKRTQKAREVFSVGSFHSTFDEDEDESEKNSKKTD